MSPAADAPDRPTPGGVAVRRPPSVARLEPAVLAPMLVLLTLLCLHVALRATSDLTPWKVAGFAMFSTVDGPSARLVVVTAEVDGQPRLVALDDRFVPRLDRLRALPTPSRAEALARLVAETPLASIEEGRLATVPPDAAEADDGGPPERVVPDALTVTVSRRVYADGHLTADDLHTVTVAGPRP